ncbi:MAG: hypothetical protein IT449_00090 [Phycisphaerales bacterium]|nr:hypothetical protein [Phycisphaerales bacterium]
MNEEDLLDDLFHGCAFAAFLEQATIEGGWPDPEATRIRAYRRYEEALTSRSRYGSSHARSAPGGASPVTSHALEIQTE